VFAKAVEEGKDLGSYIIAVTPPGKPKPTEEQAKVFAKVLYGDKDVKAFAAAGRTFKNLDDFSIPDGTLTASFARSCNTAFIKLIDDTKDDAALAKECLGLIRQWHMQGRIRCADAVSTELVDSALKLAAHRNLLAGDGDRATFRAEFKDLVSRL